MNENVPNVPRNKSSAEIIKTFVVATMIPKSPKWARISKAFYIIYTVIIIPLYFLGMSELWASKAVYYLWRVNIFGIITDRIPYTCSYYGDICELPVGSSRFANAVHFEFHPVFFAFIIGGFITVRLLILCLDAAERGLGVDFLSATINKIFSIFPGANPPSGRN